MEVKGVKERYKTDEVDWRGISCATWYLRMGQGTQVIDKESYKVIYKDRFASKKGQ